MSKEQVLELLDYLEKAQEQWYEKRYEPGMVFTKINWNFVKDTVKEYEDAQQ